MYYTFLLYEIYFAFSINSINSFIKKKHNNIIYHYICKINSTIAINV